MVRFFVDEEKNGCFVPPETAMWRKADKSMDTLEEDWVRGHINLGDLCKKLAAMKRIDMIRPLQIKSAALINVAQNPEADSSERTHFLHSALEVCCDGMSAAVALIPKGFKGDISWYELDNRPFLRLHHNKILALIELERYAEAAKEIRQHLAWNKSDNIGVRFLLGQVYYLDGQRSKAANFMNREVSRKDCIPYPPYGYSLALLAIEDGRYAEAALLLRKFFLENTYIAEMLVHGDESPPYHYLFEGGPWERHETAVEYRESGMVAAWRKNVEAMQFVRWLYNTQVVLHDRMMLARKKESSSYTRDLNARQFTLHDMDAYREQEITAETTARLIRKVTERNCNEVWPWKWEEWDAPRQ